MKPSGPGALVDPMLERVDKISWSDGIAQIAKFSSDEIELSNKFKRSLSITGKEEENNEHK